MGKNNFTSGIVLATTLASAFVVVAFIHPLLGEAAIFNAEAASWLHFSSAFLRPFSTQAQDTTSAKPITTSATTVVQDSSSSVTLTSTTSTIIATDTSSVDELSEEIESFLRSDFTFPLKRPQTAGVGKRDLKSDKRMPLHSSYKHILKNDTSLQNILLREEVAGEEFGISQTLDLDNFIEQRGEYLRKRVWDSMTSSYDLDRALAGDDIARILGQSTGLAIPLPPNPISTLFGKPEISINVNGELNIQAGWRWDSQNLGTVSAFGQTQSGPIFQQTINMNVSGRIGDKLNLGVDLNTLRQFDMDNRFKVGFDGEDDDIIKRVEVGNVQMESPSTLIGAGQALFGVRADFQFGPLFLKTIASQRRGERRFIQVQGGRVKQPFQIRAYDYAENHFFLDEAYKAVYKEYFRFNTTVLPSGGEAARLLVKEIEVFESTNDLRDVDALDGVAYADLESIPIADRYPAALKQRDIEAGVVERGRFRRLTENQYEINRNLGTLTILNLRRDRYYAVAYRIENVRPADPTDDLKIGTLTNTLGEKDTLILKLVTRPNLIPTFRSLWSRQMRNIYNIGTMNVNTQETKIQMWYFRQSNDSTDFLEGSSDKIVTVFGVDRANNGDNSPQPDGLFDIQSPVFFNPMRGEIIFPSVEPFREGLRDYFTQRGAPQIADRYIYSAVYDTIKTIARMQTEKDRFIIAGEVSGAAGNRIALPNAFNLAPGGVRIRLNGRQLAENQDFRVDYVAGQIIMLNPQAAIPTSNLDIEYEQNDVINLATRTLVGLRADLDMKPILRSRFLTTNIGFTVMSYDQALLIDRVQINNEPVNNTMFGFDGRLEWKSDFITRALDLLPFYDTKEQSLLTVQGEWAKMLPTPNKRLSNIPEDGNQSVVYVDDFEGSMRPIPLGTTPQQWTYASPPRDSLIAGDDTTAALYRGNMFWYRYFIPRVDVRQVYPNRQVVQGQARLSPLEVFFIPQERGIYNRNPEYLDSLNPEYNPANPFHERPENREKIWGGLMRLLSPFNTNFDVDNIDYIEIRMKYAAAPGTKMYIDLGQISEDIIPDRRLSTEDGITTGNPVPNNIIDPGEDIGIDALADADERAQYPFPLNQENDPARDNFRFNFGQADGDRVPNDFRLFNGLEGNADPTQGLETGQFPDTEILNRQNGQTIMLDNSFFRYEVNLDQNPATNRQIVGAGEDGWLQFRIPIRGNRQTVGNPSFANIQYVRVWFKGGSFAGQIADWRLAGSQWFRMSSGTNNSTDTSINVAFVGLEENAGPPDFYTLPPGVDRPAQLNNPDPNQDIRFDEKSLSIAVRNLIFGEERQVARFYRPFDMFYYKELKFFAHGDDFMPDSFSLRAGAQAPAFGFIRFGYDTNNYYEYRFPLTRGWKSHTVNLAALTSLKQTRDSADRFERMEYPVPGDTLLRYAIKGEPTLTRVQVVMFGIANPVARFPNTLTTTMWVNELRLLGADNSADWAALFNAQLKLADLGNVSFAYNNKQPNFHRLEDRFGDRIQSTNWTLNVQLGLEKFFPKSWSGTAIPFTYTRSEQKLSPRFMPQNDIDVNEAAFRAEENALEDARNAGLSEEEALALARRAAEQTRERAETVIIQDAVAVTGLRIGLPSKEWYINDTFNKLVFGFNYTRQFERSPIVAERFQWQWMFSVQHSANITQDLYLQPFGFFADIPVLNTFKDFRLTLLPTNLNTSLNVMRTRTTEQSRFLEQPSPVIRQFTADKKMQFSWRLTQNGLMNTTIDYSLSSMSTLVPFELDENFRQRSSNEVFSRIFFNNGRLIDLGEDMRYNQNLTLNFKPRLAALLGIERYLDITGSYSVQYARNNQMQQNAQISDLGKDAQYNANLRFTFGFRLKQLADSWFGTTSTPRKLPAGRKPPRRDNNQLDSSDVPEAERTSGSVFDGILSGVKTVFLDYDNISFNFTQSNNARNPGVLGGTGFNNLWTRLPFGRDEQTGFGPSVAYQLGLVSNPHGGFRMVPSGAFPFFGFESFPGVRPPNATMQDNYTQTTRLDARTSRPLWEGATLELNMNSDFGFNRNQTVTTNEEGIPFFSNVFVVETYNRSYLSMPSIFGFNPFGNTIQNLLENYGNRRAEILAQFPTDTLQQNQRLLEAAEEEFESTFEAFSFFPRLLQQILPRVNWRIRWDGLEKWSLLDGVAQRISLEHAYRSNHRKNVRVTDIGRVLESQQIEVGFQPLIGVNLQFDEKKLDGTLTANLRYNTTTSYQLSSVARATISENSRHEFQLNATYRMRGFKFPFLGIDWENDFEAGLIASYNRNFRGTYDLTDPAAAPEGGRTLDGSTQILIEPSARYSLSRALTIRAFFRYEGNFNEGAAQPGFSTSQLGVDIRLAISGGR